MNTVLWLLLVQGSIGAFDTVYYHEWRARLPAQGGKVRTELTIHAIRDFLYAVIFATLPYYQWHGAFAVVLIGILSTEIILTLTDFVVERTARKHLGDVYAGERVTHAIMGIIYGAMIASLIPSLANWLEQPTAMAATETGNSTVSVILLLMAIGVFFSGLRDLYAVLELPYNSFPWKKEAKQ